MKFAYIMGLIIDVSGRVDKFFSIVNVSVSI